MANQSLHFRRCHVCGTVTNRKAPVDRCEVCGKFMSPFFYFDEKTIEVQDMSGQVMPGKGQMRPIIGLAAFWSSGEEQLNKGRMSK
jgi:hypothetical protein